MKNGNRAEILIVEDDPKMSRFAARALKREGFDVQVAETAREALRDISASPPDLILLDVLLPDLSGHILCRRLRESAKWETPVIFMSARSDREARVGGFRAGGQDYLPKPFFADELIERVWLQLRLKRKREEVLQRNAELESRERTRRDFLCIFGDEWTTHLTHIISTLRMMREDRAFSGGEYAKMAEASERAAEVMLRVLRENLNRM